jgi:regulator of nucleoside diphosphate kinase
MTNPTPRISARLPKIHIDKTQVGRLEALASAMMRRSPEVGERLLDELARAKLVAPEKLQSDIVTLGNAVTYRDLSTGREQTVVLVYPEEADIDRHRISVVTPIGVALLGLRTGATISWVTREGETRVLEVVQVQPAVPA